MRPASRSSLGIALAAILATGFVADLVSAAPISTGSAPASGHPLPRGPALAIPVGARWDNAPVPQTIAGAQMQVVCPPGNAIQPPNDFDDPAPPGCPRRVYDVEISFGNPSIAVQPDDVTQATFFSLGGDPVQDGPTDRSRVGAKHTMEITHDQGLSWEEQPDYDGHGCQFGEDAAGTMDSNGTLYGVFLSSCNKGAAGRPAGGQVDLVRAVPEQYGFITYSDRSLVKSVQNNNTMLRVSLVDVVPDNAPPSNETASNGTGTVTGERLLATWLELGQDARDNRSLSGWIGGAIADPGAVTNRTHWTLLRPSQRIGPCQDASGAVVVAGRVYIACSVGPGPGAPRRSKVGDIDVWSIDAMTGNATRVASTGLHGGRPMLAATPSGYMVATATSRTDGGHGSVKVAFGWNGRSWHSLGLDLGPALHALAGGKAQLDLGVNALAVADDSKDVLLIYKEWSPQGTVPIDPLNPPAPGATPRFGDFVKIAYAFNECDPQVGALGFTLGTGVDGQGIKSHSINAGAFNDDRDGLQRVRDPGGGEIFTFAVDDYGAVQVASIIDPVGASPCVVLPPIPPPPLPPIPQALTVTNPANVVVGSVAAIIMSAMLAYLVLVKKRATVASVAEDR